MNQTSTYDVLNANLVNITSISGLNMTVRLVNDVNQVVPFYTQIDSVVNEQNIIDGYFPSFDSSAQLFFDNQFVFETNNYSGFTSPSTSVQFNVIGGLANSNNVMCNFKAYVSAVNSTGTLAFTSIITGGVRFPAGGDGVIINNPMTQVITTNFPPADVTVGISTINSPNIFLTVANATTGDIKWIIRTEKFYNIN